jgi:hypothetical protein
MLSTVPASSMADRIDAANTDYLANIPYSEIIDKAKAHYNAANMTPETTGLTQGALNSIDTIINNVSKEYTMYDYVTNLTGTNITLPEYLYLMDYIQNQTKYDTQYNLFLAYALAPDENFTFKPYPNSEQTIIGTPNLIMKESPYLNSYIECHI